MAEPVHAATVREAIKYAPAQLGTRWLAADAWAALDALLAEHDTDMDVAVEEIKRQFLRADAAEAEVARLSEALEEIVSLKWADVGWRLIFYKAQRLAREALAVSAPPAAPEATRAVDVGPATAAWERHWGAQSGKLDVHTLDDRYRDALLACAERYAQMAAAGSDLMPFIEEFRERIPFLPLMKLNRWVGYIQGCLIERGVTTVEAERDWTRPVFRPLDFAEKGS